MNAASSKMSAKEHSFSNNALVKLKNQDWLDKQRVAGKVVANSLSILQEEVRNKTTKSCLELNDLIEKYIIDNNCQPTFKNYKGFPAGVCISLNKEMVHGIPKDYKLQDGDVVSFDLGATYMGAIADSAITCIYGTPKSDRHIKLIKATEDALMKGIASIKVGNRLGCIGNAISKHAKNEGFGLINNYGGHGLNWDEPHAAPFVMNKAELEEGIRIQPGLSIAIEPMLVMGTTTTRVLSDGWTVVTDDINCHQEHSIFVHNDSVEILTWRENEHYLKSNRLYFNETAT
jgi:methionyl aminopeptidase